MQVNLEILGISDYLFKLFLVWLSTKLPCYSESIAKYFLVPIMVSRS